MNLGNQFPVPQQSGSVRNEGLIYMPDGSLADDSELLGLQGRISTERPILQANYNALDEADGESWSDLLIFGSEVAQVTPSDKAVDEFDHDFSLNGCYYQNLMKMSSNGSGRRVVPATSYHATGTEYMKFQSPDSILQAQMQALSGSQGISTSSILLKTAIDGTPTQHKDTYNLNSSLASESGIDSCAANRLEFAPNTPEHGKQLTNRLSDISAEESLPPKKDEGVLCTSSQGENSLNEHLGDLTELSPSIFKERIRSQEVGQVGIDLNKAPSQSAPRRRKHRPKVVREKAKTPKPPVEKKPKKTPKPKPNNLGEKPPVEGKPKRTPKPKPPSKRKGAETETSVYELGNEASVGLNSEVETGVRRELKFDGLNFEAEAGVGKNFDGLNFEADADKWSTRSIVETNVRLRPFDLNMESPEGCDEAHAGVPHSYGSKRKKFDDVTSSYAAFFPDHSRPLGRLTNYASSSSSSPTYLCGMPQNINLGFQQNNGGPGMRFQQNNGCRSGSNELLGFQQNNGFGSGSNGVLGFLGFQQKNGFLGFQQNNGFLRFQQNNGYGSSSNGSLSNLGHTITGNKLLSDLADLHTGSSNGLLVNRSTSHATFRNGFEDPRNMTWLKYQRLSMLQNYWENYFRGVETLNAEHEMTTAVVDSSMKMKRQSKTLKHAYSVKVKEPKQGNDCVDDNPIDEMDEITKKLHGLAIRVGRGRNARVPYKGDSRVEGQNALVPYKGSRVKGQNALVPYKGSRVEGQNALVPYNGDSTVVPYVDPIKKSKPRPRVDLDPETIKAWNLLMHEADPDSAEPMGEDSEKKWETLREEMSDKIHTFISRMHQLQGDRGFIGWNGSVLDSVIGVFLTQNVSDHLSSSAYINLMARFPAKDVKARETCSQYQAISWVEEPGIEIRSSDGTVISRGRKVMQQHKKQSSETLTVSSQGTDKILNQGTVTHCANENSSSREEDVISSQNSSESFCQITKFMRSSPESEVEDDASAYNPLCCLQNSSFPSGCFCSKKTLDTRVNGSCCSEHSVFSETEIHNHLRTIENLEPGFDFASHQDSVKSSQVQTSSSFHLEGKSPAESPRREEAAPIETGSSGDAGPTGPGDTASAKRKRNVNKAKKRNVNKAKETANKAKKIDWDRIKRDTEAKYGIKERTKETMDALDYEALKNADVALISRIILERGMNNMLAERIKGFLDRLMRDHGTTDLEWLRDAPPEVAKDYLLSFKGLGLKSVECVRLLTLQKVAFPVDTNVGRIAVRLGWVPLQPLPESLQLHLLELYPILETIQKYLWPRLCKLDQRTLYELHYQLITFGKVFCTKKNPNCNACPMRAECRHFASAFASARFALPSPEEKRMVNSTPPMPTSDIPSSFVETIQLLSASDNTPPVATSDVPSLFPMRLLPDYNNNQDSEVQVDAEPCEPIIEEPASPEPEPASPESESVDSDIEDFYCEDPDEIPTITLNLDEFKTNVESAMRAQNMGIQLGEELSSALVSLDASAASIPVPKLKNVSRLRTEHRVYELPDSHPLLKDMEMRDPDDPTPYLLAIWGPGEAKDSAQPPEYNSNTVKGTLLIPCRTAMRGSFPLNGTYFQVNEVFADHASSMTPIDVPRDWLWNLKRRAVYFGTSVTSIFRGMNQGEIQACFWKGNVCVRGFDRIRRTPKPLNSGLHEIASKKNKENSENSEAKNKGTKEPKSKGSKEPKSKGSKEPKKGNGDKEPKNKENGPKKGNGDDENYRLE